MIPDWYKDGMFTSVCDMNALQFEQLGLAAYNDKRTQTYFGPNLSQVQMSTNITNMLVTFGLMTGLKINHIKQIVSTHCRDKNRGWKNLYATVLKYNPRSEYESFDLSDIEYFLCKK